MASTWERRPTLPASNKPKNLRDVPSWVHLAAGAAGGITTSILTSPLDVLRTRLQSDLYRPLPRPPASIFYPFRLGYFLAHGLDTFTVLGSIKKQEGWRGLYRGIGPSLAGVVPATAIKFYVYGNCKRLGARYVGCEENSAAVHALAAIAAGLVTATATNPIWLLKTRLQLDKSLQSGTRQYKGSLDCIRQVVQNEGIVGLYRGLSASYLGSIETCFHLVLYERLKALLDMNQWNNYTPGNPALEELTTWINTSGAAGGAKLMAVLIAYPHEVIRTRLRQAPTQNGQPVYSGLVQCFVSVWKQERWRGLYGGLTPHLARSIPSAVITLGMYEFILRLANVGRE